jgi:non-ribosomal peptide synthetase component F/acyl carrier protein
MAELNAGEPGQAISGLLARHAHETPDAPALVSGAGAVSYRELDRRVSAFARGLRERGVGSGDRVACRIGGTGDLLTALLAVDRTGASWVVPGAAAGPTFVLTGDLVASPAATPDGAAARYPFSAQPAALARRVGLGRSDVVLLQGDPAPAELLAPVAAGAAIVGAPALTGRELDEWTARFGVTTLLADPSRLAALADGTRRAPAGLRVVCTGAFPPASVRWAAERWWLHRHTGTGLCLTATAHDPGAAVRAASPLAGIRPVVLDDAGEPLPWGVLGALWLDGDPVVATGERARLRPDGRLEIAVAPDESGAGESGPEDEAVVLRLFREALGAGGAGADDDFFDLGGDSSTAVRLAGLVRSEFGGEPDPELVFDFPTARALAAAIARR